MIHTLLSLTRPLIGLDTETTGVDPAQDRIIEIGVQIWKAEGLKKEWRQRINPGIPIPPASTAVHGITDADMEKCRDCGETRDTHGRDPECPEFAPVYTFKQLAANFALGFHDVDYCGQNVRFDLRILYAEMVRAGVAWNYSGARIIDTSKLEILGEPRHLSDLYRKHLGEELVGAHGALADVRAAMAVASAQLTKYTVLPRDLDALHQLQWPGWIDAQGLLRFHDHIPIITFGKHRDKPMKTVPSDYWKWIMREPGFSLEMKRYAEDALSGVFPEETK